MDNENNEAATATKEWEYGRANLRKVNNGFLASFEVSVGYNRADTGETFFPSLGQATNFIITQIANADELAQGISGDDESSFPPH